MAVPVRDAAPALPAPGSERWWSRWAVVLPFVLLFWVDQYHHTLFFDELNAFGISAASPNLRTLFHYVHFEGHPWLWYFLLWIPSRFTHDPAAMKWVEALLGTAILLVLGLASPFRPAQRLLLLSGYFFVWEYTVMDRMYSIVLLCTLVYLVLRSRRPQQPAAVLLTLGIMASADMVGVLFSFLLLLEYIASTFWPRSGPGLLRTQKRSWAAGLAAYIALTGFAYFSLRPDPGISWAASGRIGSEAFIPTHIRRSVVNVIAAPWWPINPDFPRHFWNTDMIDQRKLYWLLPVVLFAYWRIFRTRRRSLLLMAATIGVAIVFADVIYVGHVRNWGITFLAFLACLWLQAPVPSASEAAVPWSPWTYFLLSLSTLAGILAITGSWLHPFSQAGDAAAWLAKNVPPSVPVSSIMDMGLAPVAEAGQRPVYFLECRCFDTFKLFAASRNGVPEALYPQAIRQALNDLHTQQLVLDDYRPFRPQEMIALHNAGLDVTPLKVFDQADDPSVVEYIYGVRRLRQTPPVPARAPATPPVAGDNAARETSAGSRL